MKFSKSMPCHHHIVITCHYTSMGYIIGFVIGVWWLDKLMTMILWHIIILLVKTTCSLLLLIKRNMPWWSPCLKYYKNAIKMLNYFSTESSVGLHCLSSGLPGGGLQTLIPLLCWNSQIMVTAKNGQNGSSWTSLSALIPISCQPPFLPCQHLQFPS